MNHLLFEYLTCFFQKQLFKNENCEGLSNVEELKDPKKVALLKENKAKFSFSTSKQKITIDFDTKMENNFFKYTYIDYFGERILYGVLYLHSDETAVDVYVALKKNKYENSSSKSALFYKEFKENHAEEVLGIRKNNLFIFSHKASHVKFDELLPSAHHQFLSEYNLNLFDITH